jgi:ribose 1,5-bisphosphate isomerase
MAGEHPMALPVELVAALQRVENDREHGASWLAREVARALAEASQPEKARDPTKQLAQLRAAAAAFATARPSMAAVANSAARIWAAACVSGAAPDARLRAAHEAAQELLRIWDDAPTRIAVATSSLLSGTLFTHSRSGTVEAMLHTLVAERKQTAREVLVTESRPGGEGIVLARALTQAGWRVTLLADAASGHFMRQAEAVVLGADSVRDDGSFVNKVGSYLVALAARDAQVPVYVLCETLKIAAPSFPLVFEEMKPDELLPHAPPGITPRNIYFDLTPARLISSIITEQGILSPADIRRLSAEAGAALSLLTT